MRMPTTMELLMKNVFPLFFALFFLSSTVMVSGCSNSSDSGLDTQNSLNSIDLTGTWIVENETETYKTDTGEYLSSDFVRFKYVLEETNIGVKYDRCWEYGATSPYGIKAEYHFYMNPSDNGFSLQDDGSLKRITEFERDYQPGFNFRSIENLTKISDQVSVDNGTFVLNGPIANAEYDHVCLWQAHSNIGDSRTIEILTPFDNDSLSLRFDFQGDITPGTYQYTNYYDPSPVTIDISSNSDAFWAQVDSNILAASNVEVVIIESNNTKISGTYTLTGQDAGMYSGEFEMIF
jgi:hypothetical protein